MSFPMPYLHEVAEEIRNRSRSAFINSYLKTLFCDKCRDIHKNIDLEQENEKCRAEAKKRNDKK